jgi:membrane glycosyltransferase
MHGRSSPTTPAGLQNVKDLARRRRFVACLNLFVYVALLYWLASILGAGGLSPLRLGVIFAFAVAAPWSVLGVCNAAIGFWLLHGRREGLTLATPFASADDRKSPISSRVAMLLTLRNEDAARAFARLRAMKASLDETGEGAAFDWFVLSDTNDSLVASREETAFAAWRAAEDVEDAPRLHYRRRDDNRGYKAGNIRDFCDRWGGAYDFMIPLDADSLMDGETVLRLVRIGEAHPRIGILQSLVVGAPSRSAFARIFQFGMRHGMRSYTMGATWWAGDCGPYWGHNALLRIAPFARCCVLPKLDDDRHILSHDQIEAVLMRAAGYEVRVLPVESGSYEENPPTLLDFARRDLRWCEGNLQYVRLLGLPGLLPMSRFQLVWAISMFVGAPAWTALVALGALIPVFEDTSAFPAGSAAALYLLFLLFFLAPKLLGFADVLLSPGGLARYGGGSRFLAAAAIEIVSSFIIGAVTTLNTTMFLLSGRKIGWDAQARDAHGLAFREAFHALRAHLAFGVALFALGGAFASNLLLWSLPLILGYLAATPFALWTASPALGVWFARHGLCATPEELALPKLIRDAIFLQESSAAERAAATPVPAE